MFTKIAAIFFIAFLVDAEIFPGPCRTVEEFGGVVTNFDYIRYSGLWFEIERYDNFNQQNSDCNEARYERTGQEQFFYNTVYSGRILASGATFAVPGVGRVSFPNQVPIPGMLNTTFTPGGATDQANYWILSTDYNFYSSVVSCAPVNATHRMEFYWLFGRVYPLPQNIRDRTNSIANEHFDVSRIRQTVQGIERCF